MTTAEKEVTDEFLKLVRSESAASTLDLIEVWPLLDPENLTGSFDRYATGAQLVIQAHKPKVLAATDDFYAALRELAGAAGDWTPTARQIEQALAELLQQLLLSGPVAAKVAISKGYTIEKAMDLALVLSSGVVQKWVIDAGRARMMDHVWSDQTALGWSRASASAKPCAWCRMLISRGATYKYNSEKTASFKAHRHCKCFSVPVFEMTDAQSAQAADYYAEYSGSRGDLNALRRDDYANTPRQ